MNCFWPAMDPPAHSIGAFSILENRLVDDDDDSTLFSIVHPQALELQLQSPLNRDLGKVSGWCDDWGMQMNEINTATMIVYWSCTMHPSNTHYVLVELC